MASLVASHGRTTPLVWHTVEKAALQGMRNETEDFVLQRLREVVPEHVRVVVLADRGFGDQKFYALLEQLKFDYVVRFRQCIQVMDEKGEKRSAGEWVPDSGRALRLTQARVTQDEAPVPAVVCVKKRGMKEPWCLATSLKEATAAFVVGLWQEVPHGGDIPGREGPAVWDGPVLGQSAFHGTTGPTAAGECTRL